MVASIIAVFLLKAVKKDTKKALVFQGEKP